MRTRKLTHRALALTALLVSLMVAGWQAPALSAYSNQMVKSVRTTLDHLSGTSAAVNAKATASSLAAVQQTKEEKYARMRQLLADIAKFKAQPGQQASLDAAQTELNQISASMGGDLPGNEGTGAPGQTGGPIAIVAPAPPGCVLTAANVANNTPTAILDVATATSTIAIAGAGPYLWDLNMVTNITHTFAADLDITITSPAGTVVTLTTDNGAGNDNVFAGTTWDDQGGTPATDFVYANLTVATPLVAEEALGAFRGENPNGNWTITIVDDLGGDTGTLNNWSLAVNTLPAPPPVLPFNFPNNTPTAINDVATVSSTITVAGAGPSIVDADLGTFITHTFAADLDITLTSPAGTVVTVTTDNGGGNDNVFNGTGWDDGVGTPVTDFTFANNVVAANLVVEEAMSAFQGENPNGVWTLTITDDLNGDFGSLNSWALEFVTSTGCALPCVITCPANQTAKTFGSSAVVTYPAPTTSGDCGTVTCTPASGGSFAVGTTTVTCSSSVGQQSCQFTVTVIRIPGAVALNDVGCTAPGDAITGTASITNTTGASAASTATITLGANLLAVPGTCTANVGTCVVVTASTINWSGTLANGQSVAISYTAQINNVPPGTTVCATLTANLGMPVEGSLQGC
ncbi:MAG: proprotein convertase P-domain-containing protein, partial [Acidobacteriota bacterium]